MAIPKKVGTRLRKSSICSMPGYSTLVDLTFKSSCFRRVCKDQAILPNRLETGRQSCASHICSHTGKVATEKKWLIESSLFVLSKVPLPWAP